MFEVRVTDRQAVVVRAALVAFTRLPPPEREASFRDGPGRHSLSEVRALMKKFSPGHEEPDVLPGQLALFVAS